MSVILFRHSVGLICQLGDGTLTGPTYYPGVFPRPPNIYASSGSYVAYDLYPSTTPDQICKVIREYGYEGTVLTGPSGYQVTVNVSAGFPPSPIAGSPFTADERVPAPFGPYYNIYPRWIGETAWDFNAYPASAGFTPQGIAPGSQFNYAIPGAGISARFGVSYDTGIIPNDPAVGGDSHFDQQGEFLVLGVFGDSGVCCWNEGTEIELNVDIWQIDFTPTPVAMSPGVFDFTTGTPSFHSTLTHTVTIDSSWENFANRVHTFSIPKVVGHFTYVNDFYVSAITAP